jgi:hypothetical protein
VDDSYVIFGGVPENATRGESFKQPLKTQYNTWWTTTMNGLYYGDDNIQVSNIDYAIIDTGTSLLYMGTSDY